LRVASVPVDPTMLALLPRAQMSDAYRVVLDGVTIDAATAARRMFSRVPWWVRLLLGLRNRLVAPFGLKAGNLGQPKPARRIGIFPVITETPHRILLGLDDKHLDFRIAVDVAIGREQQHVTATTLVRTHNLLGRTYLATVLPFHRVIVPALLAQAAAN
jgi:hypothetical protein